MAAKQKTATLVRVRAPSQGECKGCVLAAGGDGRSCNDATGAAEDKKSPLYCGNSYQWRLQTPAQRGEG